MSSFEHIFVCLLVIYISSLEKCLFRSSAQCLFRSSAHFFDGVAFLILSCWYILEINPLSVVSFAIIFSHFEGCLFTLLIVSFAVLKLLSLIRSHLFTFDFSSVTLDYTTKLKSSRQYGTGTKTEIQTNGTR